MTIEDLLDNGQIDKTAEWGINDHSAMIEKISAANALVDDLTEGQIQNLADYFVSLPSEVAMKLWTVLGESNNTNNVISLHKAETSDGKRVSDHLVEILGGNTQ